MYRWGLGLGLAILITIGWILGGPAQTPGSPAGPVVLTVAGSIDNTNRGPVDPFADAFFKFHEIPFDRAIAFDLADLEALGMTKLKVRYPNWPGPSEFEGPLLRDVLAAAGATGTTVRVMALDGYAADIPVREISDFPVVLAIKRNGRYLGIGDRGPAWIIFPRGQYPVLAKQDDTKWVYSAFFLRVD